MSIRIMTRVWDARGLPSSGVRLVLLKLADCANDAGERAFPSVQTIAEDCELGRATVQRALRWLEAEHWIQCVAKPVHHRPAEWAIRIGPDGQRTFLVSLPDPRAQEEGPQSETPAEADQGPHPDAGGASSTTVRGLKRDVALYVPRTVKEPSGSVQVAAPSMEAVGEYGFEVFWHAYPRKVGKAAARAVWLRLRPSAALRERMFAALAEQRHSEQWLKDGGQFIPHPQTWLRQGRWDDEPVQVPTMNESTTKTLSAGARWLAKQQKEAAS